MIISRCCYDFLHNVKAGPAGGRLRRPSSAGSTTTAARQEPGGWRGLSDPETHFHDLGVGFYDTRIGPERAKRNHIRQLEALGYEVTLEPAA